MNALARRLARLEARQAPGAVDLPVVLFLCPHAGEPAAVMIVETGETLKREPGESLEAFERRADKLLRL